MIYTVTLNPVLDRTLTVPTISFNEVLRATSLRLDWGGKGFNVSRALQALGGESIALGLIGGATGRMLEGGLQEMGIRTDLTPIAGETRTNIVIAEEGSDKHIKVNEPGPHISAQEQALFLEKVRQESRPGDRWVFSGSLPPGIPDDFYARLISLIQSQGGLAFLDTSGEPLRMGCTSAPYLVKPNLREAQEASGVTIHTAADRRKAAEFFLGQGIDFVALSMGEQGLWLASQDEMLHFQPPPISIGNPTGAGDALLAGYVWALEKGYNPDEAARWGVACGSAAAMHPGTGLGTLAEIEALYPQVLMEA